MERVLSGNQPYWGALEWNFTAVPIAIIDTSGDIRWFMNPSSIYDLKSISSLAL